MKKIYRKLFEFLAWLGWVTGYEWLTGWAARFYVHSLTLIHMRGNVATKATPKEEKEVKDQMLKIVGK
jgi:hypothetical protein